MGVTAQASVERAVVVGLPWALMLVMMAHNYGGMRQQAGGAASHHTTSQARLTLHTLHTLRFGSSVQMRNSTSHSTTLRRLYQELTNLSLKLRKLECLS